MNKATIFELAKGFRGRAKNCIRAARPRVEKALQYAYADRRNKKRDMRGLWIERINAGARQYGVKYSELIDSLKKANIDLNRKVLSELAVQEPFSFRALVQLADRRATPASHTSAISATSSGAASLSGMSLFPASVEAMNRR